MSSSTQESVKQIKLTVLGKSLVGKTALAYQFIKGKFRSGQDTTIEDRYKVVRTIDNVKCEIEILDTAGQDDYQIMFSDWIKFAEGVVLVYSIDDKESFTSIKQKYEKIQLDKSLKICVIVVGNKCDWENNRQVSMETGKNYAESIGAQFFEVSAWTKTNVEEAFMTLVHEVLLKKTSQAPASQLFNCCTLF